MKKNAINSYLEHNLEQAHILSDLGIIKKGKEEIWVTEYLRGNNKHYYTNINKTNLLIGATLKLLEKSKRDLPPRSKHLGGMNKFLMSKGFGKDLTFNYILVKQRLAYSHIIDINQTPSDDGKGDVLYLPGTEINQKGMFKNLDLYTIERSKFKKGSRKNPLFSPFVMIKKNNSFIPLLRFHKDELKKIEPGVKYISETIIENELFVRTILTKLFQLAKSSNDSKLLELICDRAISKDAVILSSSTDKISLKDKNFIFESNIIEINDIVNKIIFPFYIASDPERLFNIKDIPDKCLCLSKELVLALFYAVLDLYDGQSNSSKKIAIHFHWGGIQMAGLPPFSKGYFSHNSARKIKKIFSYLYKVEPRLPKIYYVLLGSAPFLLWPNKINESDCVLMESLFKNILELNRNKIFNSNNQDNIIYECVKDWYTNNITKLSTLFLNRFLHDNNCFDQYKQSFPEVIEPKYFRSLSWRQLNTIVGTLYQCIN